jgi:hypothetical protein
MAGQSKSFRLPGEPAGRGQAGNTSAACNQSWQKGLRDASIFRGRPCAVPEAGCGEACFFRFPVVPTSPVRLPSGNRNPPMRHRFHRSGPFSPFPDGARVRLRGQPNRGSCSGRTGPSPCAEPPRGGTDRLRAPPCPGSASILPDRRSLLAAHFRAFFQEKPHHPSRSGGVEPNVQAGERGGRSRRVSAGSRPQVFW